MKRTNTLALAALVAASLIAAVVWWTTDRAPTAPGVVDQMAARNRSAFGAELAAFADRQRTARAALATTRDTDAALQLRVQVLVDAFAKMHDANRMLARDELRGAILDDLLAEPGYLELAGDVAVDWRYAEALFGKGQALARVSSIELLKRAAEHGDPGPIEHALTRLDATLNAEPTWQKGQQHDYTDLIAGYVNTLDTDQFLRDPKHFFDLLKVTDRTATEIARGLYDSKMRAVSRDVLRDRLGPYLASAAPAAAPKL